MATLYSNVDALEATGLVKVETQDGGGLAFAPTTTTIPAGYRDIIITGSALGTHTTIDYMFVNLNADTTAGNYVYIDLLSNTAYGGQGTASVRKWGGYNQQPAVSVPTNTDLTQAAGFRMEFLDYANTVRRKMIHFTGGWVRTAQGEYLSDVWTRWNSASAITSLTYTFGTEVNLAAGSSFTVWVR